MSGELQVDCFTSMLNETNMYFITDWLSRRSILVDPSDAEQATDYLRGHDLHLDYMLLTHEHYDHICALNEMRNRYSAPVISSKPCSDAIQNPGKNLSRVFNLVLAFKADKARGQEPEQKNEASTDIHIVPYRAEAADITFQGELVVNWKEHEIRIWEAPGHSKGSVLIVIDGDLLFSGDTLSWDYELITSFPGGSRKEYQHVTQPLLMNMESHMEVYPGHGQNFQMKAVCNRLKELKRGKIEQIQVKKRR